MHSTETQPSPQAWEVFRAALQNIAIYPGRRGMSKTTVCVHIHFSEEIKPEWLYDQAAVLMVASGDNVPILIHGTLLMSEKTRTGAIYPFKPNISMSDAAGLSSSAWHALEAQRTQSRLRPLILRHGVWRGQSNAHSLILTRPNKRVIILRNRRPL